MLRTTKFSLIGLTLALGVAGCVGRIQKPVVQPQPTSVTPSPSATPPTATAPTPLTSGAQSIGEISPDSKIYYDEKYKLSFQYPSTWEPFASLVLKEDLIFVTTVTDQDNLPPGAWMMRVMVKNNAAGLTEQRWMEKYLEGKYYFVDEKDINGIRWSRFDIIQAGRFPETPMNPFIVAALGDYVYLFEGHTGASTEDFNQLETIVRTAKFSGEQVPPEEPQWEYRVTQLHDFMIKIPPRWKAKQYDAGGFSGVFISPEGVEDNDAKLLIHLVFSSDFFGENKKDFISWVKKGGFTYDDKKPTISQSKVIPLGGKDVIRQVEDGKQVAYYADLGEIYFDMKYSLTEPDKATIEEMVNTIIFQPTEVQAKGAKGIP